MSEVHIIIFLQHSFRRGTVIVSSAMSLLVDVSVSSKTMLTFTPVLLPPLQELRRHLGWRYEWSRGHVLLGGRGTAGPG